MQDFEPSSDNLQNLPPIKELTKAQRRVLGTLIEKALTVPESYPLTLKAATAGCNQKSNRHPVTNYTEDAVVDTLDELRALGVAAVVHTESGRTDRYRHYVRKRFPFTEPQLAIMAELWLRGRQQPGELRTRASRMVPIESQAELRAELDGLLSAGYLQADGPLDRRGVEVDHAFYTSAEGTRMSPSTRGSDEESQNSGGGSSATNQVRSSAGQENLDELRAELSELRGQLSDLREEVSELKRNLGV